MWNEKFFIKVGNALRRFIGFDKDTAAIENLEKAIIYLSTIESKTILDYVLIHSREGEQMMRTRLLNWIDELDEGFYSTKLEVEEGKQDHAKNQTEHTTEQVEGRNQGNKMMEGDSNHGLCNHSIVGKTKGKGLEERVRHEHGACMKSDEHLMLMKRGSETQVEEGREILNEFQNLCKMDTLVDLSNNRPNQLVVAVQAQDDNNYPIEEVVPETQPNNGEFEPSKGKKRSNNGNLLLSIVRPHSGDRAQVNYEGPPDERFTDREEDELLDIKMQNQEMN